MIAYSSPAATKVAEAFDAELREKLLREGLELLVGNENCWLAMFEKE